MRLNYFSMREFACPCCSRNLINEDFAERLDRARAVAGVPFVINSGFRCPGHNLAIGGKGDSAHLKGVAADIRAGTSQMVFWIVDALIKLGFRRIGISKDFIHVDCDDEKPQGVIWTY